MRLNEEQLGIIKRTTAEVFGDTVRVRVFGSRLEDASRGGDIDLLVEGDSVISGKVQKILSLTAKLQLRLGDQPIDILVVDPETPLNPVHRHALETGRAL